MSNQLSDLLKKVIPQNMTWKIKLLQAWPSIAGALAEHVTINYIDKDKLILQTHHPAWAQELNFLAPYIHQKIDELIGKDIIRSIVFTIKKRGQKQSDDKFNQKNSSLPPLNKNNYVMTRRELEKLNSLQDADLRIALKDYLLLSKARK